MRWPIRLLLLLLLIVIAGPAPTVVGSGAVLPSELSYKNPLGPRIPDPQVLRASDGRYYVYGTTGFKAWSSDDLVKWQPEGSVYRTTVNSWGLGSFWAPEVVEYEGQFYLFYTADIGGGSKRIGVAVSSSPTGPFTDPYDHPILDPGYGVIDPHVFFDDDGRKYLYYSRAMSENIVGDHRESHVYVVELGDDLVSLKGEPILLSKPEQSWELQTGGQMYWNEGPTVFKRNGVYYLMWSANSYAGRRYSVGYATSSSPTGPFTKYAMNPVLSAAEWGTELSGPGHNSVIQSPDGSEWFIVYHTHIDPAQGGGPRQLNIDRMGFRADGSVYVNGPSLTPQPTPSGHSEWRNIAGGAAVTVSSVGEGFRAQAVVDGEIAFDPRFGRFDWVSAEGGVGAWVQLTWEQERAVRYVLLYDSAVHARKIKRGHVLFSDGTTVRDVQFPPQPGAAVVVPAPDKGITWVRLVVDELVGGDGEAGMSEIVVLGRPLGEDLLAGVWISSPQPGTVLSGQAPLRIAGSPVEAVAWEVQIDDSTIFQGDQRPEGLVIDPSTLMPGWHMVEVAATGASGEVSKIVSSFEVQHVRVVRPRTSDWLQGSATVEVEDILGAASVERAVVSLRSLALDGSITAFPIFSGSALPAAIDIDTHALADGPYDLCIELWTRAGVHSVLEYPVAIRNWVEFVDPLLPPLESGWFGVLERDATTERSAGWAHATDTPEAFWGDADRLYRKHPSAEYLIWRQSALDHFTITLFAADPGVVERTVSIAVSADGQDWSEVPYSVQDLGRGESAWHKLELTGRLPMDAAEKSLLRVELAAGLPTTGPDLQIGHVVLVGCVGQ